jgi:hypothetical protein
MRTIPTALSNSLSSCGKKSAWASVDFRRWPSLEFRKQAILPKRSPRFAEAGESNIAAVCNNISAEHSKAKLIVPVMRQ